MGYTVRLFLEWGNTNSERTFSLHFEVETSECQNCGCGVSAPVTMIVKGGMLHTALSHIVEA